MLECYSFTQAGYDHKIQRKPNEDCIQILKNENLVISVVTDGAGGKKAGAIAAQIVASTILNWLENSFLDQYYCDGEIVRRRAVQVIRNALMSYARETDTPETELACTLMASAMDAEGRCICLHLGDGTILRQRECGTERQVDVISPPENGLLEKTTYLTMCCNMFKHLRYYRWKEPNIKRIIMMTDGAFIHVANFRELQGWTISFPISLTEESLNAYLVGKNPQDDFSYVVILKDGTGQISQDMT